MLDRGHFIHALVGAVETLQWGKTLTERGLAFAWVTFPEKAKGEITNDMFTYACTQRILDPEPRDKQGLHIQLLFYLYPTRDGVPDLKAGLRKDLHQRMADPSTFHPLVTQACHQQVTALPEPKYGPPVETREQRIDRLYRSAREHGWCHPGQEEYFRALGEPWLKEQMEAAS